jgi:HK97 family phage major capsid protein
MNLKEITEKLAAKGKTLSQIYEEAGADLDFTKVKCIEGDTTAKVEALRAMDAEVTELKGKREELMELEAGRKRAEELNKEMNIPVSGMTHPTGKSGTQKVEQKSIGQLFVESKAFQNKGMQATVDIDLKTTMSRSTGWDPEAIRIPRIEKYPLRKLSVLDLYPQYPTGSDTIKYMKETTFTNNAAEAAEEGTYGEGALALTQTSDEVEKVAVWLPVTDEQLEDVAGIGQYVNDRLTYMLRARIDSQLLVGDGTSPNIWGASVLSGVQTQAKGTDPTPDAVFKAMTKVRGTTAGTGFAEPSAITMHPNDWQAIRLLRTADGIYIFGSPTETGPDMLWGVPVVVTSAMTEGTGLVGDWAGYSAVFMKRGITFKVTDSHASLFITGIQAIRADVRLASVYFRDSAFCTVTGI